MASAFVLSAPAAPAQARLGPACAPGRAGRAGRACAGLVGSRLGSLALLAAPVAQAVQRRAKRREGFLALVAAPQVVAAKTKQEATDELMSYAMKDIVPTEEAPGGWQWVVEGVGLTQDAYLNNTKFQTAEPTIVRFLAPPFWSVATPRIDYNGGSGTVQINNYAKGDSATVFVDTEFKGNLAELKPADWKKVFFRALTLKGSGSLMALNVGKVTDLEGAPGYKFVTLDWTLFTGAGFEIDRDGFAVVTQVTPGGPLQILWGGVVSTRYKEMKDDLQKIVKSFRCMKVPEGIKIEMKKEYKDFSQDFREQR